MSKNGTQVNGRLNRIADIQPATGPRVDSVLNRFASVKSTGFKRRDKDGKVYNVKLRSVPETITPDTIREVTDTDGANVTRKREVAENVGALENTATDRWGFKPEDNGGVAIGYLLGFVKADELPPEATK